MATDPIPDVSRYCRELEAYLCRKNDGHLIRIVGPAFGKVCGWAEQGIPFRVACRGIDRYFDRYYAKGPRRRPVRIEFCEADVLDAFDEWRRAVGLASRGPVTEGPGDEPAGEEPSRPRSASSLPAHLERVAFRLTSARGQAAHATLVQAIDRAIDALEAIRARARGLRGDARTAAIGRLEEIDRALAEGVRAAAAPEEIARETRDAERELAPFAARMPAEARHRAITAAVDRALRERAGLPAIRYE